MRIKVPHFHFHVTTKERHILEVIAFIVLFIVVFYLLHRFNVFGFVFGTIDSMMTSFEETFEQFINELYYMTKTSFMELRF